MTNEFADLGTPTILLICDPSLVLQILTVLSVKKTTANFQHLDNFALLGYEFLRICAQTSCWIKSNTSTASLVIIKAYLSSPPSCRSLTPMRTDILPLLQHGFHYILLYNFIRIESMENKVDLSSNPEQITDIQVKSYMQCFLDISDFKKTENAKSLLELVRVYPDHSRTKSMMRTVVGMFNCNEPAARVCSLQFLKQALETGSYFVLQTIEKNVLNKFAEIVQYRSGVKGLSRGSTYFIKEIDKNIEDEEFMTLVRLSSTFFRMVQECLYVWGALYFPGSTFDRLRLKMGSKIELVQFPKDFKFFSEVKINNFKIKCQNLIKKLQERKTDSMITSKKSTINKQIDKRSDKLSQINSKKQLEIIKKKQKSEQNIENLPSSSRGQKKLPSKKKKQKKKFVQSDEQKEQRQLKQKLQRQVISNNSSKLRKKNSFDEGPTVFHHNSSPQSSSDKHNGAVSTKAINLAQPITERQQSQGGRYSIKQSDNFSNTSEQLRDIYQNRKESSPRSQFSVTQAYPPRIGLKRQISQQLTQHQAVPINTPSKKKESNAAIKSKVPIDPKIERVNNKISIRLPIDQGKKKLKNAESQYQDKVVKSSKRKKLQTSAPKRFVSSQQQNHHDRKQTNQEISNKAIKLMEKNQLYEEDNISNFEKFDKKNQKVIDGLLKSKKQSGLSSNTLQKGQLFEAKSINSSPQRLKEPAKLNNTNVFKDPVRTQRVSKPQKIKSNSNLQTVFQSTDFKIIANNKEPKKQKITQNMQKPKQKKQMKKIDIFAQKGSKKEQKSIFDAVQMSSIKTVQQIPLTNTPKIQSNKQDSFAMIKEKKVEQNPYQQSSTPYQTQSDRYMDKEQSYLQQQSSQYSNLPKQSKDININNGKQTKQKIINEQKANQQLKHNPYANDNQIQAKLQKKKQQFANKIYNRPKSIKTSRQFRHFKEVNLFIDPYTARVEPSRDPHEIIKIDSQQIESALKEKIVQEFHKLRTELIQKQEQNLNNTITSLKQQIQQNKRERIAQKNQCSTQTKIRHKSKSKFEKKRIRLTEDDLTQNKNDQNSMKHKFSKTSVETSHQNHHLTNIGNNQPYHQSLGLNRRQEEKKQQTIREEMKPNTLLYALYRRKSIHI